MMANINETRSVTSQFLSFFAAGEEYGLGILDVKELVEYSPVTRVPSVPPYVKGVVNLRGRVVPVIDLATRFGFGDTVITRWACIVMVEVKGEGAPSIIGLIADRVSEVVELAAEDIEPAPAFGTRARQEFLRGVGKEGERFVLLLDIERLLNADDLPAPETLLETPMVDQPSEPPTAELVAEPEQPEQPQEPREQ
jgi:purine-binding chemotaxis protein CheW